MYPYHLYPCTYFIGTYLLVLYYLLVQPYCTTSYGSMVPAFSAVQTRVTKGHPPGQRAAQRRAVCSFYLPPCFCTATSGFVASSCALCWPCCLGARRTCGLLRLRTRELLCVPPCSCAACYTSRSTVPVQKQLRTSAATLRRRRSQRLAY